MTSTISGVSTSTSIMVQQLNVLTNQLDDLQRQLSTGQKVDSYAGISSQAQLVVGLNSQLAAVGSFQDSNNIVNARLAIAQSALTQFDSVTQTVQNSAMQSTYQPGANGQTSDQTYAASQLNQLLNLMNTQADGRFLFSGAAVNQQSVAGSDVIVNGNGAQAGLKQMISERNQADLGSNGLGRLVIPPIDDARVAGSGAAIAADAPAAVTGSKNIWPPYASAGGTLVLNGTNITIPANSSSTAIVSAINGAGAGVTASINGSGNLVLTGPDATTAVNVGASTSANLLTEFGVSSGATNPTNLVTQGKVANPSTLTLQVGANAPLTVNFGTGLGQVQTLGQLATALQGLTGGIASVDANGNISVAALNTTDSITTGGTATLANFGIAAGTVNPPVPGTGTQVSVAEDAVNSPFGFKLASISSTASSMTVSGPTGSPAGVAINVAANPNPGDAVTVNFNLPDGTTAPLTLTATTASPPATNQFTIGATAAATAANLQTALTTAVGTLAGTQLTAASAVEAGHNFFDVDATHPPQRVAGPPFATATALVNGTAANTVAWYTGGMSSDPRNSVTARIDSSATAAYGVQANEQGLRSIIENVAVFSAVNFQPSNTNSGAAYLALGQRVGLALNTLPGSGKQTTQDIETDLANVQTSIQTVTSQQQQTQATLQNFVQGVTGVSNETVAAEILTLQTQLQASLQTTAMLTKMTLTNYLSPA